MQLITIVDILKGNFIGKECSIGGWVRSLRKGKKFSFMVINDGSCHKDLQIVIDETIESYDTITSLTMGYSLVISGKIVASKGGKQDIEMHADSVSIMGTVSKDYPLQKNKLPLEFLREHLHLRARTSTISAIMRIRHHLSLATHKFFSNKNFYYLHTPILTSIDAEGAGEMFSVTTFNLDNLPLVDGKVDYNKDYFKKLVNLCVTGQLHAEAIALGMRAVYTFGPTFRSENSNTSRHLSEFWMIEPEVAFMDLKGNIDLAIEYIKYLINYALVSCPDEMHFLLSRDPTLDNHYKKLEKIVNSPFQVVSYTEAISLLKDTKKKFEFPVNWGSELQSEHERFLTEEYFKAPVVVIDYPKDCKAFYMKQNDDGKTVAAMDVLLEGVGEIIGGSQREDDIEKLKLRMQELNMKQEPLNWYLDLRRFGSVPHSGFGLGFERAISFITGIKNVKDVIAFPLTPGSCNF